MKKRKKYMVTVDNSEAFACSLVTNPAVQELFVAFSEDKQIVEKLADEKKHMVTGIVAIPSKPIYRNNGEEEFDLVFSAEAIESMAKKFMKNFRQTNVTLQHQENADGIYMVEQWIKRDAEKDKSVALGFSSDIPVGTWFQTYYVDSKDVWDRITSGELRGFSLECALSVAEIDFEEQAPTVDAAPEAEPTVEVKESILDKILNFISPKAEEAPKEEPKVEEPTEKTVEEETKVAVETEPKKAEEPKAEDKPQINPLDEVVKNLKDEIKALKKNNESLLDKIKELGQQPSAKPTNTAPTTKPNSEDTFRNWREQMKDMIG